MHHAPNVGDLIAEKYRLEVLFGQGGMGSVWRAHHLVLNSAVAIKLLDPAIAGNVSILERFLREAQSAAALRSMHVVQIFDYGVDAGRPYIAMELLNGESLGSRLERVGRLSPRETARIIRHVARAMSKAHASGIVHRDLKPDNVYIVSEEEEIAKVLDFGIAKIVDPLTGGSSGSSGTQTGALLGTPFYMSPEQAQGIRQVDKQTDLWAMAVIAFECLVGRRPFVSEAIGDLVLKICTQEAPVPSEVGPVPRGFDAWFRRGIAKDPNARFQSAEELSASLFAALGVSEGGVQDAAESLGFASTAHNPIASIQTARSAPSGSLVATEVNKHSGKGAPPLLWLGVGLGVAMAAGVAWFLLDRTGQPGGAVQLAGQLSATAEAPPTPVAAPRPIMTAEPAKAPDPAVPPITEKTLPARKIDGTTSAPKRPPDRKRSRPPPASTSAARVPKAAANTAPSSAPPTAPRPSSEDLFGDRK